ncbi:adenosylmethionine decarboxylase [Stratiformator vulcanicus]|uniref:S-adenosylmethionine decarboxylase proenzyme n=1 Tax=Stratiformator vulcanicus TaxID=2527980 RepID=A0A517R0Q5_9PLAN|nr:adenosylmethionine decarboxylase [Stratiformator vulcanicus]QDT37482.1 S-adenosylmethionine decarboxylase proenzyme precursor [Stratiformator vulcanicus]
MGKGNHVLIDCRNVPRDVCLDDGRMLEVMARSAAKAGMHVISQVRYHFGHNSAPGYTCVVLLDESHCSAHTYADLGLIALDVFTCGDTDPRKILEHMREELDLGDVTVRTLPRFTGSDMLPNEATVTEYDADEAPAMQYAEATC